MGAAKLSIPGGSARPRAGTRARLNAGNSVQGAETRVYKNSCIVLIAMLAGHPVPFERGGRWGYKDAAGRAVSQRCKEIREGAHASAGEWKSIDRKGRVVAEESIGSAWMEADGTVVLQLRAAEPGPAVGDALFRYPKTHPQYDSVLRRLGGLKAGERKPVPPWSDT